MQGVKSAANPHVRQPMDICQPMDIFTEILQKTMCLQAKQSHLFSVTKVFAKHLLHVNIP